MKQHYPNEMSNTFAHNTQNTLHNITGFVETVHTSLLFQNIILVVTVVI